MGSVVRPFFATRVADIRLVPVLLAAAGVSTGPYAENGPICLTLALAFRRMQTGCRLRFEGLRSFMSQIPRLAVGSFQPGVNPQACLWALMEALRSRGIHVQSFLSRACFPRHPGAMSITGLATRHLDSWLMSRELCRELFVRGAKLADLALVEGRFGLSEDDGAQGGQLDVLCQWLELPRVAVVDVGQLGPCRLPARPAEVDGLLLDRVPGSEAAAQLAVDFEVLWGVPVLGALEALPRVRSRMEELLRGSRPPRELYQALGANFARHWRLDKILELATSRDFCPGNPRSASPASSGGAAAPRGKKLTVAIALDEAFNCYFPNTLDLLEQHGAVVVDFSPLRDEHLPPQADVVYLGCGHPERYAVALSENHCMMAALRSHVCAGRRIYAEGGGAAYLCQQMETPQGEFRLMAGVLPAVARLARWPQPARPVEVTLARPTWLATKGTKIRGYQNSMWRLEPIGRAGGFVAEAGMEFALAGSFHAVGSLLHVDFAAEPALLNHFFRPASGSPEAAGVPPRLPRK